jgi:hypothetical protein
MLWLSDRRCCAGTDQYPSQLQLVVPKSGAEYFKEFCSRVIDTSYSSFT